MILPTCVEFLDSFLGVILAGGIPAPLYPPIQLGKLDEYFARTQRMLEKIDAKVSGDRSADPHAHRPARAIGCGVLHGRRRRETAWAAQWTPVEVEPESPAFLQFSSGTTLEPKAVIITHKNLLSNLAMIDGFFEMFTEEEVARGGVCWLPLYHDMGLIGCMFMGLYHPGTVTYIGPDLFISRPRVWLETMSRYKAIVSPRRTSLRAVRLEDQGRRARRHRYVALANRIQRRRAIDPNSIRRFTERFARWGSNPKR